MAIFGRPKFTTDANTVVIYGIWIGHYPIGRSNWPRRNFYFVTAYSKLRDSRRSYGIILTRNTAICTVKIIEENCLPTLRTQRSYKRGEGK